VTRTGAVLPDAPVAATVFVAVFSTENDFTAGPEYANPIDTEPSPFAVHVSAVAGVAVPAPNVARVAVDRAKGAAAAGEGSVTIAPTEESVSTATPPTSLRRRRWRARRRTVRRRGRLCRSAEPDPAL